MFYVGKGQGQRAWNRDDRHYFWTRYIERNLGGKSDIRILADGLGNDEAETLESAIMMELPDRLVNWVNWG